jgi:hypothetical protein
MPTTTGDGMSGHGTPEPRQAEEAKPPVYVSGGKRLNFDRHEPYGNDLTDTFVGSGKSDGTYPSCTWEELCAMAKLVVDHPAFRLPDTPNRYSPPMIEDEPDA